ncbi:ImmA/IrrE family metallo-endopeptidase [Leptospira bouyouniensis]|uniref:ImmA/IrrE family metallo-endopeptidase n=1 Tax=Leptospira bouyouniensis TaxID=2484911 RepID=A0ABY2KZ43_9LEPT|nr:hypothetical protein [Leptospira bouyouniensis]TGK45529.1 hypothetical protein EHQ10_18960 [Leptospira bouyouniensis]
MANNQNALKVKPLSYDIIDHRMAVCLEKAYGQDYLKEFPLNGNHFFEDTMFDKFGFSPDIIETDAYMGAMDPIKKSVILSKRTHDALEQFDPRALFSLLHEFAHASIHAEQVNSMIEDGEENVKFFRKQDIRIFENSEWQANVGAVSFGIPRKLVFDKFRSGETDVRNFLFLGFSYEATSYRIEKLLSIAKKNPYLLERGLF